MVASETEVVETIGRAVSEMDSVLGRRISAMVISGASAPPRRGVTTQEGPQFLTARVLVAPMVRTLGYTEVTDIRDELEHTPGLVIAITAANRPLREASEKLIGAMRAEGTPYGMATDGIRWMMAATYGRRPKIVCMTDLRPYYLEALDRSRFRVAVPEDRRNLRLFSSVFSKQRSSRSAVLSARGSVGRAHLDVTHHRRVQPVSSG